MAAVEDTDARVREVDVRPGDWVEAGNIKYREEIIDDLEFLDDWNDARRRVADAYYERLRDCDLETFRDQPDNEPVHHLFVAQLKDRQKVQKHLQSKGIQTGLHYPVPIHLLQAFRDEPFAQGQAFPHSEKLARELVSLPMHPNLGHDQIDFIAETLAEVC